MLSDSTLPKVNGSGKYAMNQSEAEKAGKNWRKPSTAPGGPNNVDEKEGTGLKSDAQIWSLYLEKATKEANQQAEQWKTDLESLLLFAGLFAGVVSSFVVDSRHDLQPQTKAEALLADIRNTLRNETTPRGVFEVDAPTLWTNGLWFTSLVITLFSAMMGILAKSWVVKFVPVTGGRDSNDAYQRWIRDEKAKLWYLGPVITILPGFIHLALFLFVIGFGLQSVGDNLRLGWVVLGLIILGTLAYLGITIAPFFFAEIPYQTPLYVILNYLKDFLRRKLFKERDIPREKPRTGDIGSDDILLEIWRTQLVGSGGPSNLDTAIADITKQKLSPKWWDRFAQWGAPNIVRQRLRDLVIDKFQRESSEILRNHLRALSGFLDYLKDSGLERFKTELEVYLNPGNPLHRWNIFPDEIRALAFSIRTPILLAVEKDYTSNEIEERPWEAMVYHMLPSNRRDFAMAACRGLVGDQKNLQRVSVLSIILRIAKESIAAVGPKSEWRVEIGESTRDEVRYLGRKYLGKLFKEIAKGWEMLIVEIETEYRDVTMFGRIMSELGHSDVHTREKAITTLEARANDPDSKDLIKSLLSELAAAAANDVEKDVRLRGVDALIRLRKSMPETFKDVAKTALLKSLGFALEHFSWVARVIEDTGTLIKRSDFQDVFQDAVEPLIFDLIKLTINTQDKGVRAAGTNAVRSLMNEESLQSQFNVALSKNLNPTLQDPSWDDEYPISGIMELVKNLGVGDVLNSEMSRLLKSTRDETGLDIRIVLMKMLFPFAQGGVLVDTTLREILRIPGAAIPQDVHSSWIDFLNYFVDRGKSEAEYDLSDHPPYLMPNTFLESIRTVVPILLRITMTDDDEKTRRAGVETLASLARDESLLESIKGSLLSVLELALEESYWQYRVYAVGTLKKILEALNLQEITKDIIHKIIHVMVNDGDDDVCSEGAQLLVTLMPNNDEVDPSLPEMLESEFRKGNKESRVQVVIVLEKNAEFRLDMKSAVPAIMEMVLNDSDYPVVQRSGLRIVGLVAQDVNFQDIVHPLALKLIDSMPEDSIWSVRVAWLELLTVLSKISVFQPSFESVPIKFIESAIDDPDEDVRAAGINTLGVLAQLFNRFRDVIKPRLTQFINLDKQAHWKVRVAFVEVHRTLAQIPDFQAHVESSIPELTNIATNNEDEDIRVAGVNTLIALAQNETFRDSSATARRAVKSALPEVLDSASKDIHYKVRIAWAEGLIALVNVSDFRDTAWELATQKLIKITVGDEDSDVREIGVQALTSLTKSDDFGSQDNDTVKFRKSSGSALSKEFDSSLKMRRWENRYGAIQSIKAIIQHSYCFQDSIKSLFPHVVRMIIDDEDPDVRSVARELMDELCRQVEENKPERRDISDAALDAIPSTVALINPEKHEIPELIDSLQRWFGQNTDKFSNSMDRALVSMLYSNLWLTRAAGVKIFAALHEKYKPFKPFIQSALPGIVTLALEDTSDDVRKAGIHTLVNLAKEEDFRDNIKANLPQFIELLKVKTLRTSVTQLISLLAINDTTRRDIIPYIINPLVNSKPGEAYPDSLLELLSRLIIDKRFEDKITPDYVALSITSVLFMQPHTTEFRRKTVAALSQNYGTIYTNMDISRFPKNLVENFLFTIFGRHVTEDEVKMWRTMDSYLPTVESDVTV